MLDNSRSRENSAISTWAHQSQVDLYPIDGAELCSVLVANAPSSISMVFGERCALWVNYLMQGLDINSRVVFTTGNPTYASGLKEILRGDLRYTVHAQDYLSFVDDIRRYQISLLIMDTELGELLFKKAAELLDQSGYAILLGDKFENWKLTEYQIASLRFNEHAITLVAKRAALAMPKARKGGRGNRRRGAG